jgi:hypothetical protein
MIFIGYKIINFVPKPKLLDFITIENYYYFRKNTLLEVQHEEVFLIIEQN